MCRSFLIAVLLALGCSGTPAVTGRAAWVHDVREFGAVGDGQTLDTKALQAAIDQCSAAGGGTVLVTHGSFLTGTLYLKSDVCLRIEADAEIRGSANLADYATDTYHTMIKSEPHMDRCLLFARDAHHFSLEGRGRIDGQGKSFPNAGDPTKSRPMLIRFLNCSGIRLRDLTLQNPAAWTSSWLYCTDVAVDGITIRSRANINGDGLDFDGCSQVRVSHSTFDTSDDCICLQTSRPDRPCRDVTVTNCVFTSRWAGLRLGLLSRGDIERVTVTDCTFRDIIDSGVKIQLGEGAVMQDMVFTNLVMTNVLKPVFMTFTQHRAAVDAPLQLAPMRTMRGFKFSHITVKTATGGRDAAFIITGLPGHPIADVTLSDIQATFAGGATATDAAQVLHELTPENLQGRWPEYSRFGGVVPAHGFYARHVQGLVLRNVEFHTSTPDARPAVVFQDVSAADLSAAPVPTVTDSPPSPARPAVYPPSRADGPYTSTWDSLRAHYRTPAWLQDAKFGIFIHWGVYAVPAHASEWYPHHMYATKAVADWHRAHFGPQDKFGYKDFIPLFRAEHFDPAAWAALFKRAGARYVVPVAEHHDGFAMYDSALTTWNAKAMGPHRDVIGELAAAVRHEGLAFGLSNHRMEHWSFMFPLPGLATDLFDPAFAEFYGPPQPPAEHARNGMEVFEGRAAPQSPAFLEEWLRRNQELVDKYHPSLVYFDNGVNARALDDIKLRFAAYYYNRAAEWGVEATVATKRDAYLAGSVRDYERGRPAGLSEQFWQCDTSIAHNSWGYVDGLVLRNAGELIRELADCVAKNGGYLLNIAPRADGTIPDDQQLRLLEIGDWLRVNGEAIYGSRPWLKFGEGPITDTVTGDRGVIDAMLRPYTAQDMRFTTQRHADGSYTLYAILFAWPDANQVTITSLALSPSNGPATAPGIGGEVEKIELLGNPKPVKFQRDATGLHVTLPAWKPSDFASVLKITGLKQP